MNTLIQIASGAGYGKSVLASRLYVKLTKKNKKVELVQELVKKYAYLQRELGFSINDCNRIDSQVIYKALKQNEFVIYDNSVFSYAVYSENFTQSEFYNLLSKEFRIINLHISNRNFEYNPIGRLHSDLESTFINLRFRDYMQKFNISYISISDVNNFKLPKELI